MGIKRAAAVLAATLGVALTLVVGRPVTAASDDLPPERDNGGGGRNNFGDPNHVAPRLACNNKVSAAGSTITRVLPVGPVHPDGTLAFISGLCVYLPPGYEASGLRYPVLYLLHGGGGDHADWVTYGNIQPTMDAVVAADARDAAIVVMPDGNDAQWYDGIDGKDMNETYVLKYVIPYVDRHYRTIADRRGRGIAGLSNGGYGALHFAAKAPQLFAAAGGMSSNIAARSMGGLGNSVESPAYFPGNIPARLYGNLDYVDVVMDLGAECKSDVTVDLCATFAFDQLFRPDHIYFDNLMKPGHVGAYDFRLTEGGHAWRWWTKWLVERDLPFILPRLDDPQPVADPVVASSIPSTFRYRSIFRTFDAWGYKVTVDQRDVREFLDLTNVTVGGMTVQGSGLITIETAPRYTPGAAYSVAGNSGVVAPAVVVADTTGRLTFPVDLGPSHVYEEESYPQQALVAAGGYWQHRDVSITAT